MHILLMHRANIKVPKPSKKSKKRANSNNAPEPPPKRQNVNYREGPGMYSTEFDGIRWPPCRECSLRICDSYGARCFHSESGVLEEDGCRYCESQGVSCEPLNMNSVTVTAIYRLRSAVTTHAVFGNLDTEIEWITASNEVRQVIARASKHDEKGPLAPVQPVSDVGSAVGISPERTDVFDVFKTIATSMVSLSIRLYQLIHIANSVL
ncbi:hypothetical protein F4805DRAFT_413757 [Annulohypoxylon moriforme]|nr:hypothetical protein F4805DRAFT_413757 [Annulohypoxylon moriforme]